MLCLQQRAIWKTLILKMNIRTRIPKVMIQKVVSHQKPIIRGALGWKPDKGRILGVKMVQIQLLKCLKSSTSDFQSIEIVLDEIQSINQSIIDATNYL